MSNYLDVNGDGQVDDADRLLANDQIGEGGNRSRFSTRATTCTRPAPGRRSTARSPISVSCPGRARTGHRRRWHDPRRA